MTQPGNTGGGNVVVQPTTIQPPVTTSPAVSTNTVSTWTTLEKVEKLVAYILGLLITALGAATAIKGVVPAGVSAVLTAALPVVIAMERFATTQRVNTMMTIKSHHTP